MSIERMLPAADAARSLGISDQTVLNWIHRGQLPAVNVAALGAKRPRYLVRNVDLDQFLASRRVVAT